MPARQPQGMGGDAGVSAPRDRPAEAAYFQRPPAASCPAAPQQTDCRHHCSRHGERRQSACDALQHPNALLSRQLPNAAPAAPDAVGQWVSRWRRSSSDFLASQELPEPKISVVKNGHKMPSGQAGELRLRRRFPADNGNNRGLARGYMAGWMYSKRAYVSRPRPPRSPRLHVRKRYRN